MLVSFTLLALGRRLLKCSGSCDMQRLGPENETAPRRGLFDQSDLWSHMQMRWVGVGHGPSDDGGEYTPHHAPVKRNSPRILRSTRRASGGRRRCRPWHQVSGHAALGGTCRFASSERRARRGHYTPETEHPQANLRVPANFARSSRLCRYAAACTFKRACIVANVPSGATMPQDAPGAVGGHGCSRRDVTLPCATERCAHPRLKRLAVLQRNGEIRGIDRKRGSVRAG